MGRACRSFFTQRAMRGLCVAWNPLMAPQAMVMKRQGKTGSEKPKVSCPILPNPSQTSGKVGIFTNITTIKANAMKIREKANKGYTFPIILSIGIIVAMM